MDLAPGAPGAPVLFDERLGQWFVYGYDDVRRLLVDERLTPDRLYAFAQSAPPEALAAVRAHAEWLISPTGGDYEWIGPIVRAGVRGAAVHDVVAHACEGLLDGLSRRHRFDLVTDYALPLSAHMVASFLGVDHREAERLVAWGLDLVDFFSDVEISVEAADRMARSVAAIGSRGLDLVRHHAIDAERGFLAAGARAAAEQGRELDEEAVATITVPLITGHVDAAHLVAMTVWLLLDNESERARLARDPRLLVGAVREALRFGSPVALVPRTAREPIVLHGHHLEPGDRLQLSIATANRDPTRFPEPDRFDITRTQSGALAFGHGARACIAAGVARAHTATAVEVLFRREPELALDQRAAIRWRPIPGVHSLQRLDVRREGRRNGPQNGSQAMSSRLSAGTC
jgi:cytochrome P450